jgi:hypothetical protein
MTKQDYANKQWLPRPPALRRWHVLLALAALALLAVTSDPTDCDGKRCYTSFDSTTQTR